MRSGQLGLPPPVLDVKREHMSKQVIEIGILNLSIIFIGACNVPTVELPIDTPDKAITIAKQDKEVQTFIKKWSQDFRISFDAQYLSGEKTWLVRIFPKGDIKDVEFHVVIKEDGTIINRYYPRI